MKFKSILFYAVPFLLTVILILFSGIPVTLEIVTGWLFVSIFWFGIPIVLFCFPYWFYFIIVGKYYNKKRRHTILALIGTIILIVLFLICSAKIYKPIENKIYFTKETKMILTKRSLALFEERMHTEGKLKEINKTSRMEGWNDVEVSGLVEGRELQIIIISKNKEDKRTISFNYLYKNGKWSLESTKAQIN